MGRIVLIVIIAIIVLVIVGNLFGWLWGILTSILTSTVFWVVAGVAAVAAVVYVIRGDDDAGRGHRKKDEKPSYGQHPAYRPPEDTGSQGVNPASGSQEADSRPQYDMEHPRSYILPPDSWDVLDGPSLTDHVDDRKDKED